MIGHFNADELASYRAGAVSDGKAARIGAHLSGCPQCAGVDSGLADVSQMLASIPVPAMPEALTLRLQATIAEEAAQRAAATPVLIPGRPDLPPRARRHARRPRIRVWSSSPLLLRGLAAAGGLVLLVGGGILLANQGRVGTSSGLSEPAPKPANSRLGTSAIGSTAAIRLRYRHGGEFAYTNAVTSEADYTKTGLRAGIRREVANSAQLSNQPSVKMPGASAAPASQQRLSHTTVGQLQSCLSTLAAGRLVFLVEIARYLDQPATIIIFNPVNNAFDVIVVGDACGPANQDVIRTLTVPIK